MAALPAIAMVAQIAGAGIAAAGTLAAGDSSRAASTWQANEYERQAKAERAGAQREAEQIGHRTDLARSRLQAVASASGFSATDPTALNVSDDITEYGALQEGMARYAGEDRATGLRAQGAMTRYSGQAAHTASRYRAVGTILGGIGGLARYRDGGTTSTASSNPYHFG